MGTPQTELNLGRVLEPPPRPRREAPASDLNLSRVLEPAEKRAASPSHNAPAPAVPSVDPRLDEFVGDVMGEATKRTGYVYKFGSGGRTPDEQAKAVAAGNSRTYNSKHLSGRGRDVLAFDSEGNYITDGQHEAYKGLGDVYRERAASAPVRVKWGGDFKDFYDPSHFELDEDDEPASELNLSRVLEPASDDVPSNRERDTLLPPRPSLDVPVYRLPTPKPQPVATPAMIGAVQGAVTSRVLDETEEGALQQPTPVRTAPNAQVEGDAVIVNVTPEMTGEQIAYDAFYGLAKFKNLSDELADQYAKQIAGEGFRQGEDFVGQARARGEAAVRIAPANAQLLSAYLEEQKRKMETESKLAEETTPRSIVPPNLRGSEIAKFGNYGAITKSDIQPVQLTPEDGKEIASYIAADAKRPALARVFVQPTEAFAGDIISSVGNVLKVLGVAPEFAEKLRHRGLTNQIAAETSHAQNDPAGYAEEVGKYLFGSGLTIAKIVTIQRATGASLPAILVGESYARNLDKDEATQLKEAAKAAVMGKALEAMGGVSRLQGAAAFGAADFAQGVYEGDDAKKLIARTVGGALTGGFFGNKDAPTLRERAQGRIQRGIESQLRSGIVDVRPLGLTEEASSLRAVLGSSQASARGVAALETRLKSVLEAARKIRAGEALTPEEIALHAEVRAKHAPNVAEHFDVEMRTQDGRRLLYSTETNELVDLETGELLDADTAKSFSAEPRPDATADVIRYKGRDIVRVPMPDGSVQPFYRSSGRNSKRAGAWLPFDGVGRDAQGELLLKDRFSSGAMEDPAHPLHRLGDDYNRNLSEALSASDIKPGREVSTPDEVNSWLRGEGNGAQASSPHDEALAHARDRAAFYDNEAAQATNHAARENAAALADDYRAEAARLEGGDTAAPAAVEGYDLSAPPESRPWVASRVGSVVGGTADFMKSSVYAGDASATLRQALFPLMMETRATAKGLVQGVPSAFSERLHAQFVERLGKMPVAKEGLEMGLALDTLTPNARLEFFPSKPASKLPWVGSSERLMEAQLDAVRVNVYEALTGDLRAGGLTPKSAPEEFRAVARIVNVSSGRGELGVITKPLAPVLNKVLGSPKLLKSRFQVLNPLEYARLPPAARRIALRKAGRVAGTFAGIFGLAYLTADEVGLDPRKSNFGIARYGNTSYDLTGGLAHKIKFIFNLVASVGTTAKKYRKGDEIAYDETPAGVVTHFLRSQLSPAASLVPDAALGETYDRKPFGWTEGTIKRVTPLFAQDIYDGFVEGGGTVGAVKALPGFVGVGVRTRDEEKTKKEWALAREASRIAVAKEALSVSVAAAPPAVRDELTRLKLLIPQLPKNISTEGLTGDKVQLHSKNGEQLAGLSDADFEKLKATYAAEVLGLLDETITNPDFDSFESDGDKRKYLDFLLKEHRKRFLTGARREARERQLNELDKLEELQHKLEARGRQPKPGERVKF